MPDSISLPAIAYAIDGDDVAAEPRTACELGFLLRYVLRFQGLSNHQQIIERLNAELVWSVSEWRRLNPSWRGYNHEAELAAAAERLPHEVAAATALNAWGHVIGPATRIRACKERLMAQRRESVNWKRGPDYTARWFIAARLTEEDIRAHWRARRVAWRTFLLALRLYRQLRAEVDPAPSAPPCAKREAA
jgi:hypothetical protein